MTTLISFSATKNANRAGPKKCFLARVEIDGDELRRDFVASTKDGNRVIFCTEAESGAVFQYRHRAWNGERMVTHHGWFIVNADHTITPLDRDEAERAMINLAIAAPAGESVRPVRATRLAPDFITATDAVAFARKQAARESEAIERRAAMPAPRGETHVHHAKFGDGIVTFDHPNNPHVTVQFDKQQRPLKVAREALQWIG